MSRGEYQNDVEQINQIERNIAQLLGHGETQR